MENSRAPSTYIFDADVFWNSKYFKRLVAYNLVYLCACQILLTRTFLKDNCISLSISIIFCRHRTDILIYVHVNMGGIECTINLLKVYLSTANLKQAIVSSRYLQ